MRYRVVLACLVLTALPVFGEQLKHDGGVWRTVAPSSLSTSQMTPAGLRPASRQKSTAASVCPTRCNTPPVRAPTSCMIA